MDGGAWNALIDDQPSSVVWEWSATWDASGLPNNSDHTIEVQATDEWEGTTTQTRAARIEHISPTVAINGPPAAGADVGSVRIVPIHGDVSDANTPLDRPSQVLVSVANVDGYNTGPMVAALDSQPIGSEWGWRTTWDSTGLPESPVTVYDVAATALDCVGGTNAPPTTLRILNVAPVVTIQDPQPSWSIGGEVTFWGVARDDNWGDHVAVHEFRVDDGAWSRSTGSTALARITWSKRVDTRALTNGAHNVAERASDLLLTGSVTATYGNFRNPPANWPAGTEIPMAVGETRFSEVHPPSDGHAWHDDEFLRLTNPPPSSITITLQPNCAPSSCIPANLDLYVRYLDRPSETLFDCASRSSGASESCSISTVLPGQYYVWVKHVSGSRQEFRVTVTDPDP